MYYFFIGLPHVDALLRQQGGQLKELARSVLQAIHGEGELAWRKP